MTINYFPFINNPDPKKIRKDIIKSPAKFLKSKLTGSRHEFGVIELMTHGAYKEMGYYYSFRSFLTLYVYKKYDHWEDAYALNKTNLRKLIGGRIDKILTVNAHKALIKI